MKKTNKKLQLHRTTIANLTAPELRNVRGAVGTISLGASVQSIKVDTVVEPCQRPSDCDCSFPTRVPS
jgi:hypothetical protein